MWSYFQFVSIVYLRLWAITEFKRLFSIQPLSNGTVFRLCREHIYLVYRFISCRVFPIASKSELTTPQVDFLSNGVVPNPRSMDALPPRHFQRPRLDDAIRNDLQRRHLLPAQLHHLFPKQFKNCSETTTPFPSRPSSTLLSASSSELLFHRKQSKSPPIRRKRKVAENPFL
jgi:hypothetical protein